MTKHTDWGLIMLRSNEAGLTDFYWWDCNRSQSGTKARLSDVLTLFFKFLGSREGQALDNLWPLTKESFNKVENYKMKRSSNIIEARPLDETQKKQQLWIKQSTKHAWRDRLTSPAYITEQQPAQVPVILLVEGRSSHWSRRHRPSSVKKQQKLNSLTRAEKWNHWMRCLMMCWRCRAKSDVRETPHSWFTLE